MKWKQRRDSASCSAERSAPGVVSPAPPYVQDALQGANRTAHPGKRNLPPDCKGCEIKMLQKHSGKWSCIREYFLPTAIPFYKALGDSGWKAVFEEC